ncbi:MAG: DUF4145 domain-containing protein [Geobacteraceae bacterium]|nr:DUF4145 domain-containing protein [Geobacteraceae bacterium]
MSWYNEGTITSKSFTCGYCGNVVASNKGYHHNQRPDNRVFICPHCEKPSFITSTEQVPGVAPGNEVKSLPANIDNLYREARNSVAASAYTAAVLVCRKLLMNIAVSEGAEENKSFLFYVEYLADNGYVPPKGKGWVDHIRKKGNEANHEILLMSLQDAEDLISFSEMLLKFIYEFPSRVP